MDHVTPSLGKKSLAKALIPTVQQYPSCALRQEQRIFFAILFHFHMSIRDEEWSLLADLFTHW